MVIEVVLADDHAIVRQGLSAVISQEQDIKVIAEASNGKEAVDIAKKSSADIFIVDITMPILNGLHCRHSTFGLVVFF